MASAIRGQVTFSGDSDCCDDFEPNKLKPNMCRNCFKNILRHAESAVKNDMDILRGLEHSQAGEKVPSEIIEPTDDFGGLYLGGFRAIMNRDFLRSKNISTIVNTAAGLEMFGPVYIKGKEVITKELGITFLELNWLDSMEQVIDPNVLTNAVKFIHEARTHGESVLVHCAQGKSRSATVVVAYIAVLHALNISDALKFVQSKRLMADPNPNFLRQLQDLYPQSLQTLNLA